MLIISLPDKFRPEQTYVISVIFSEILGLDYQIRFDHILFPEISLSGNSQRLILPSGLFSMPKESWLRPASLPVLPLVEFEIPKAFPGFSDLMFRKIPILFGDGTWNFDACAGQFRFPVDVFGSAFFMLSRYEELVSESRDAHGRYPGTASIAYLAGFLDRPIIDEYLDILWGVMRFLWPTLQRRRSCSVVEVSCDIDIPFASFLGGSKAAIRNMIGDVVRRNDPIMAVQTGMNFLSSKLGIFAFDPNNTFDWIMDVNERFGNRVTFFFFANPPASGMNGLYSLEDSRIRKLMRKVHSRGHFIGLHSSYESIFNPEQQRNEFELLIRTMEAENIIQKEVGNRQHFLRWNHLLTPQNLNNVGVKYDSTLGYHDVIGFRCGTAHEFSMFDFEKRCRLDLRQRPLIAMDCAAIGHLFLTVDKQEIGCRILNLKKLCQTHNGCFSFLWHNSFFKTRDFRDLYKTVISNANY